MIGNIVSFRLSDEARERLHKAANRLGKNPDTLAAELLEKALSDPNQSVLLEDRSDLVNAFRGWLMRARGYSSRSAASTLSLLRRVIREYKAQEDTKDFEVYFAAFCRTFDEPKAAVCRNCLARWHEFRQSENISLEEAEKFLAQFS